MADALAATLILAALLVGVYTTRGLERPYDPDHYRDIAQAQTALDGHPLSDPNYRGEWIWYSPLLAWTLAAASAVSRVPLERVHVQAGPFLNLLGPIALYLLAARLTRNRFAALLALGFYLLAFGRDDPGSVSATYSPWLFADNFAQGLFFLTVLAIDRAAERPTSVRAAMAGLAVGATFLAHTAPGVIAATIAFAVLPWPALCAAGAAALAVASPFLRSIVGHYHLKIVNSDPLTWNGYLAVAPRNFPATLLLHHLGWVILSVIGLVSTRSRVALAWIVAAIVLTALNVYQIVSIVPASHFWIYSRVAMAVLAAAGVMRLVRRPVFAVAVIIGIVVWAGSGYASRPELLDGRDVALKRSPDHSAAARFLHATTSPDTVVLGTYGAANLIIGPAGRKTVAAGLSNPYVDQRARTADRERMLGAIAAGDRATFESLAGRYDVSEVVLVGDGPCSAGRQFSPLVERGRFGDVCVSSLR